MLKKLINTLKHTPFHPQWFAHFREAQALQEICDDLSGTVLDIGCADSKPKNYLNSDTWYIGLDYYHTATKWYKTQPSVFADAKKIPIKSASIDCCLLLDVLEHLAEPADAITEINRVLKKDGKFIVFVPFMYPIHDAPLDFGRWTEFGLVKLLEHHNFGIVKKECVGHPMETASLNMCLALSKTNLNWLKRRNPLALSIVFLPPLVLILNLVCWLIAKLDGDTNFMPYGYRVTCEKK